MLRNILIHAVVALAAILASPAYAVMPASAAPDAVGTYPAWAIVAYPEGEMLVYAPADAGND